jgi:hypothetical protein
MQATNTLALHDAYVVAVRDGVTPRMRGGDTWHHAPEARESSLSGAKLRNFYLVTGPAGPLDPPLFYGQGESWGYTLELHVSYHAVDDATLDHIINTDTADLRNIFEGLYDPTTPGLYSVEYAGRTPEDIDDDKHVTLAHLFAVVYNQED